MHNCEQKQDDLIKLKYDIQSLQVKVQKQPEDYVEEILKIMHLFKEKLEDVNQNPSFKHVEFVVYTEFLCSQYICNKVCDKYKQNFEKLYVYIHGLLENHFTTLNTFLRQKLIQFMMQLRNKNMVPFLAHLTLSFKMFKCKDKRIRQILFSHLINDIKRANKHNKNEALNRQVQSFLFEILKQNKDSLAKKAIQLLVQLYQKNIFNESKTINIIANGCFNPYYKVKLIACYFLIQTTIQLNNLMDDESSDSDSELVHISKLSGSKKCKAKQLKFELELKRLKRKKIRKMKFHQEKKQSFFPIDLIYNPQEFCEKLFSQLKKSGNQEKMSIKLAQMAVLARMIGRNKLLILSFYTYLQKYLYPSNKNIAQILSFFAESVHSLIPEVEIQGVIQHIIDNFISDQCKEIIMTMGLNTLREIIEKNPYFLNQESIQYITEYKLYKNKNVSAAAKSIINTYRDLCPELLPKKYKGRQDISDKLFVFGQQRVSDTLQGAEIYEDKINYKGEIPLICDRILDDKEFKIIQRLKNQQNKMNNEQYNNQIDIIKNNLNITRSMDSKINQELNQNQQDFIDFNSIDKDESIVNDEITYEDENLYEEQSEEENPQGFIQPSDIAQYKYTKRQIN